SPGAPASAGAPGFPTTMIRFLFHRLLLIIPTFIGITIVAFAFVRVLPGDPVLLIAGERGVTPERYQALMSQFGYDRPIWIQYWDYLSGIFRGDFGTSISTKRPVIKDFMTLFPATVELSFCAALFAMLLGVPAGVIAAIKRGTWYDQTLMGTALVGY